MKYFLLSQTAGGANNDPLVFYAIALFILGVLIAWPSLLRFVKTKISKSRNKGNSEVTNL